MKGRLQYFWVEGEVRTSNQLGYIAARSVDGSDCPCYDDHNAGDNYYCWGVYKPEGTWINMVKEDMPKDFLLTLLVMGVFG